MLVGKAKQEGTKEQYEKLNEAIGTARFVQNICLRYWMDKKDISKYELRNENLINLASTTSKTAHLGSVFKLVVS